MWEMIGNTFLYVTIFEIRKAWMYQWGNKKPQKSTDWETQTPLKTGGELMCSGMVKWNPYWWSFMNENWTELRLRQIRHIRGHLKHSGHPSHDGDHKTFEVMTLIYPQETLIVEASLLAANIYQWNRDRNHKLWTIVSIERIRYILHMQVLLEWCYTSIHGKFTMRKLISSLLL